MIYNLKSSNSLIESCILYPSCGSLRAVSFVLDVGHWGGRVEATSNNEDICIRVFYIAGYGRISNCS